MTARRGPSRSGTREPETAVATASVFARWWPAAALALAVALAYANSIHNPFLFDDHQAITENPQIRTLSDLASVLKPTREIPTAGRPFANLTFAINYAIGGFDPTGYHLWNIATHLVCAWLLFGVVRRTLAMQEGWWRDHAGHLALASALIWALHPLASEPVDYLTQRTEGTMAAMLMLTLYASIRSLDARHRGRWTAVAIIACTLGMASKETMVTAPLLVVLYDRVFAFRSIRQAWATRKSLYAGLATTWIVLAILLSAHPRPYSAGFGSPVSPATYLLNQFPMVLRYLRLALWPFGLVQNYGWPEPLTLAGVLPSLILVIALLLLSVVALIRWPRVGFLAAWVWITLAPTSSVVPIATEVGAERRIYLGLMALVTLAVIAGAAALRRFGSTFRVAAVAATAVFFLVLTAARNTEYASPILLARTTLVRYPTPVGHHVLASELLAVGREQEAIEELHMALPGAPRAHFTLAVELLENGDLDQGIAEMQAFIRAEPHLGLTAMAHGYLGKAYAQRQQWPQAIAEFQAQLVAAPGQAGAQRLLADAYFNAGDFPRAIEAYERYTSIAQGDAEALKQLGIALEQTGRLNDAARAFTEAAALDPQDGAIERRLSYVLYQQHDIPSALMHAERAVALQPEDQGSRQLLRTIRLTR